jgi:hypothetical protein
VRAAIIQVIDDRPSRLGVEMRPKACRASTKCIGADPEPHGFPTEADRALVDIHAVRWRRAKPADIPGDYLPHRGATKGCCHWLRYLRRPGFKTFVIYHGLKVGASYEAPSFGRAV